MILVLAECRQVRTLQARQVPKALKIQASGRVRICPSCLRDLYRCVVSLRALRIHLSLFLFNALDPAPSRSEFLFLDVFQQHAHAIRDPFVLVVDKLLPYIYIKVAYVKVAKLARELGCDDDTVEKYYRIALLHDVGKIAVPREVLNKPGTLTDEEFELAKTISVFPERVRAAIEDYEPSCVTRYILDLCAAFNRFYHECPILNCEDADIRATRLCLVSATKNILGNALSLICVGTPEKI